MCLWLRSLCLPLAGFSRTVSRALSRAQHFTESSLCAVCRVCAGHWPGPKQGLILAAGCSGRPRDRTWLQWLCAGPTQPATPTRHTVPYFFALATFSHTRPATVESGSGTRWRGWVGGVFRAVRKRKMVGEPVVSTSSAEGGMRSGALIESRR